MEQVNVKPGSQPLSDKATLLDWLSRLPEDVSPDELMLEILTYFKFKKGEEDIKAGRFILHDELVRQFPQWKVR